MLCFAVLVFKLMVAVVTAKGSFYVGLLGFSNPTNRTFNGTCCGGLNPDYCSSDCRLLFDITVVGLEQRQTKTPLDTTILGSKVISIPSSYEMKNPLSFSFRKWPGEVDILVNIYDMKRENRSLVDKFKFTFQYGKPDLNYRNKTEFGIRPQNKTSLRLILRYNCDEYYFENDDCSKLCSPGNTPCPVRPTGNPQSITDWILLLTTAKPSTGRICQTTNTVSGIVKTLNTNETTENCTYDINENSTSTNSESAYTTDSSNTVTSAETVISYTTLETTAALSSKESSENIVTTSPTQDLLSSSLSSPMTSQEPKGTNTITTSTQTTTLKPTIHSTQSTTLKPTIHSTSLKLTTQKMKPISPRTTRNKRPTNIMSGTSTPEPTPSLSTSFQTSTHQTSTEVPGDGKTINDDVMQYWPAIVGGVLGMIAIIAVLGVFIYVKRLRAQQKKTEDIYNVNPQTWILETNENGTSGMSEIALETELV